MLSRHMSDNEEVDFPLYPDPNMSFHNFPFGGQNFNMETAYVYPRTQEGYPASTGLSSSAMYAEAPQYALESPDLRAVPSNYSTASGPSATSSAMGSPHSIHGHVVPVPEWTPHGLGLNPGIVQYDNTGNYSHSSNDYSYQQPTGMDDFALEFNSAKPSFVGECKNVSTLGSRQHDSMSFNRESISSLSTFVASPKAADATMSMASPITPVSTVRTDFRDDVFKSPVSSFSTSPLDSRRPSQAFNAPLYALSSTNSRSQDMRSPVSSTSQSFPTETSPSYTTYHQTPFFSQSSGNFIAPLESSCWFPLVYAAPCLFDCYQVEPSANMSSLRSIYSAPSIYRPPNLSNPIK